MYDITNFRLLLNAAVQYAAIRMVVFSKKERTSIFYSLGIVTIVVAFISLLQVLFKEQATLVAKNFLFGDAAYSIASDLERGRGIQWGNIILTFPLFMYGVSLSKKKRNSFDDVFLWGGVFLLPLSFVLSNFRGLTLCFFLGALAYLIMLVKRRVLSLRRLTTLVGATTGAIIIGVVLASAVFQYNIIDRFLFKEQVRDVQFTLGRVSLYEQALSAFVASPVVGIGLGNYRYTIDRIRVVSYYNVIDGETGVKETDKESVSSHNDLLTILAETGVFGLFSYVGVFWISMKGLFVRLRQKRTSTNTYGMLFALFLCLAMLLLSGVFENTPANNIVYIFFLFGASISWI